MRRESLNYEHPELKELASYHGGHFESLKGFNSDRVINLNRDYTVASNNAPSTLKICKAGSHPAWIGFEWELKSGIARVSTTVLCNVLDLVMNKAGMPDDLFKIEADCTVDAECITQTFTRQWLRNNYKAFKAAYAMFSELDITSNHYDCGMHANLDLYNFGKDRDTQIENVRKLGYLINHNYDLFKYAFYRQSVPAGHTDWAPRMDGRMEYWKNTDISMFPTSHSSCCVNMAHINAGRVEVRLVGGQRNYPCFRNTWETLFHVIDAVKKLSWNDLDDLSKVFAGCNNYVFDRLSSNCYNAGVISAEDIEKIRLTVKAVQYI